MEIPEKIALWPGIIPCAESRDGFIPYMESFALETAKPLSAVIVLPGGGYVNKMTSYEGRDVCKRFNELGIHSFMLEYRVAPNRHPAPLLDAAQAIKTLRRNAAEWNIKPDKIAVLGFSAGGHLAASACVYYELAESLISDSDDKISARPDAGILCYPVLSSGNFGHIGSFKNLLGENPSAELMQKMSLELNTHKNVPPVFLWHTANDGTVPVENSLLFATSLSAAKIPFELHVYPNGPHGMGMGFADPHVATWVPLCAEWLKKMGF